MDSFEKPCLLLNFNGSFCQKLGSVYSPNLPIDVTGDRNKFIDLEKIFLEIECKIVQSSEGDLRCYAGAVTDVTLTSAPFLQYCVYLLFSDCTVSANGLKTSNANGNYAQKSFFLTEFSHNKDAKTPGWLVRSEQNENLSEAIN